jgi:hypothetical protein
MMRRLLSGSTRSAKRKTTALRTATASATTTTRTASALTRAMLRRSAALPAARSNRTTTGTNKNKIAASKPGRKNKALPSATSAAAGSKAVMKRSRRLHNKIATSMNAGGLVDQRHGQGRVGQRDRQAKDQEARRQHGREPTRSHGHRTGHFHRGSSPNRGRRRNRVQGR